MGNGYSRVYDREKKKYFYEHRVVFEKAYGPIPKDFHIHHIDRNKKNNNLDNLQLVYGRDHNREEAFLRGYPRESRIKGFITKLKHSLSNKTPILCVETGRIYESLAEASRILNGSHNNICNALNDRQQTAFGFHWKYVDYQYEE